MVGFGISAVAQTSGPEKVYDVTNLNDVKSAVDPSASETSKFTPVDRQKGDLPVYYSETFGNGFEGENGEWTVGGAQGDLWFHTFPLGAPNGYDPNVINTDAYIALPSYFSGGTVASETAENGFMMLDADAYNSTKFTPEDEQGATDNPIEAFLISPSFDLTGAPNAVVMFTAKYRQCCFNYGLNVDVSFDGGTSWVDAWAPAVIEGNIAYENTYVVNITSLINSEADLSNMKLRFRWPYNAPDAGNGSTNSHYYWMVDDVYVMAMPDNDIVVSDVAYDDYLSIHNQWINAQQDVYDYDYARTWEYYQIPPYLHKPYNFMAVARNAGAADQTGVGIKATVTLPDESTIEFITPAEDLVTLAVDQTDTLYLPAQELPGNVEAGNYTVTIEVFQDADDFNPNDNAKSKTYVVSADGTYSLASGAGSSLASVDSDYILGQRYYFPQNSQVDMETVITGVEFILYNTPTPGWSTATDVLLFTNVRMGSLWADETTTVYFDSENPLTYSPLETGYVTAAEDLTSSGNVVWISVDFMNIETGEPIVVPVDDNNIYQAEYRVPNLGGSAEVTMALQSPRANGALFIEGISGEDPEWGYFNGFVAGSVRFKTASVTEVKNVTYEHGIQLMQNFPNPFKDQSRVDFKLPSASDVTVEVRDIQGRLISSEDLGTLPQGVSHYIFDAQSMSPGIYTYTLVTDLGNVTRKMTIE